MICKGDNLRHMLSVYAISLCNYHQSCISYLAVYICITLLKYSYVNMTCYLLHKNVGKLRNWLSF
jgi:hypothetical protein